MLVNCGPLQVLRAGMRYFNAMSHDEPLILDAKGLNCPMPLLKAKKALNELSPGALLRVLATDPGSVKDFRVFAAQSGHKLLESNDDGGTYSYLLEKRPNR